MDGAGLFSLFNLLTDNTANLGETNFLTLANIAKTKIEMKRLWEFLKDEDSSNTVNTAGTFATEYSLPTDFLKGISVFTGDDEQFPVPFEKQRIFKDSGRRYFIHHKDQKLHLTGTRSVADTIYIYYTAKTTAILSGTEIAWPFYEELIAYDVVILWVEGIDADSANAIVTPAFRAERKALWDAMIEWDAELQLLAKDHRQNSRPVVREDENSIDIDREIGY